MCVHVGAPQSKERRPCFVCRVLPCGRGLAEERRVWRRSFFSNQGGKNMRQFTAIIGCLLFVGCSGQAVLPTKPIEIDRTYSAPQKSVWQGLIQSVTERGFLIQSSEFDSGTLTTSELIVKGNINSGTDSHPKYSFGLKVFGAQSTRVEKATVTAIMSGSDNDVRVKIRVNIQASAGNRDYLKWKPVSSNGKLEDEIFRGISAALPAN